MLNDNCVRKRSWCIDTNYNLYMERVGIAPVLDRDHHSNLKRAGFIFLKPNRLKRIIERKFCDTKLWSRGRSVTSSENFEVMRDDSNATKCMHQPERTITRIPKEHTASSTTNCIKNIPQKFNMHIDSRACPFLILILTINITVEMDARVETQSPLIMGCHF